LERLSGQLASAVPGEEGVVRVLKSMVVMVRAPERRVLLDS